MEKPHGLQPLVTPSFQPTTEHLIFLSDLVDAMNSITNAPVFADNAAAIAGGLVAGNFYKTATGEFRVVV